MRIDYLLPNLRLDGRIAIFIPISLLPSPGRGEKSPQARPGFFQDRVIISAGFVFTQIKQAKPSSQRCIRPGHCCQAQGNGQRKQPAASGPIGIFGQDAGGDPYNYADGYRRPG